MTMYSLGVVVFCILAVAAATDVEQCTDYSFKDLQNSVTLNPCKKIPCRLKKGSALQIEMKFTPEEDVNDLTNKVNGNLNGLVLPFIGVDGTSVCDKLTTEDGQKTSCPLKAGTTYKYSDSFPILDFYPQVDVRVHWALENNKKPIICFEVNSKIVK